MSEKKNPTPTADPPKVDGLLAKAIEMQEFPGELEEHLSSGWNLRTFVESKARLRADAAKQRQIDSQPAPDKAEPAQVAQVLTLMRRGRDCSPFFLGGVEWKSLEKRFSNTWEGTCPDDNGRNVKCILGVLEGGTPLDRAVREARDEAPRPAGSIGIIFHKNASPYAPITLKECRDELAGWHRSAEADRKDAEHRDRMERQERDRRELITALEREVPIF